MFLIHIKVQSIIHMAVEFHVFGVTDKCNNNAIMKEARGQNKLFHNASLLMCYCSSGIFYAHTPFCELFSAFNGISHKKSFAIFLPN